MILLQHTTLEIDQQALAFKVYFIWKPTTTSSSDQRDESDSEDRALWNLVNEIIQLEQYYIQY